MKHFGGDLVGGSVRSIHNDLQALEGQIVRKSAFAKLNVPTRRIVQAAGFTQGGRIRPNGVFQQGGFHGLFPCVRQLLALGTEKLDAVVGKRVVACADDHAQRCPLGSGQISHSRRRNRPQKHHIDACGIETRLQSTFQHVTRYACVLANQDRGVCFFGLQNTAHSMGQPQDEVGGDGTLSHRAANAICAKVLTCHVNDPDFCNK